MDEYKAISRLAQIRCLKSCIECLKKAKPFPKSFCFIPQFVKYKFENKGVENSGQSFNIKIFKSVNDEIEYEIKPFPLNTKFYIDGFEYFTDNIVYGKLMKQEYGNKLTDIDGFVKLYEIDKKNKQVINAIFNPCEVDSINTNRKRQSIFSNYYKPASTNWINEVEFDFSHGSLNTQTRVDGNDKAIEALRHCHSNWTYEHDVELIKFLSDDTVKQFCGNYDNTAVVVKNLEVSSQSDSYSDKNHLLDENTDTFWESDGNVPHSILLTMVDDAIIRSLSILVDESDDSYMPKIISVLGGNTKEELSKLQETKIDRISSVGLREIEILNDQKIYYRFIDISIIDCFDDGSDARIHGIKIRVDKTRSLELSVNSFPDILQLKYSKLSNFNPSVLRCRIVLLTRLITLFESTIQYLIPNWDDNISTPNKFVQSFKPFFALSKKRLQLVNELLHMTQSELSCSTPTLLINRIRRIEHADDPTADPDCKKTIFVQIYDELHKNDRELYDYRWGSNLHQQWWECKLVQEGIIDQGGGFRDTLSDISDELCPGIDKPLLLPLFIHAPNQRNATINEYRDTFVPNPSCNWYKKYEWLGKLMGACFRSKESLVMSLSPLIWKKLIGDRVFWSDFSTVDDSDVKVLNSIENMTQEEFEAYSGGECMFEAVLSDGSIRELYPGGSGKLVTYENRIEYRDLVKQVRLTESDKQIEHMRKGFLSVIPQSCLDLLTWKEVETRVCGSSEISLDSLKNSTHYEDDLENDTRTTFLWKTLEKFDNNERSKFIRFISGRKRLPAPIYICSLKNSNESDVDSLPESSTCSNTLFLPKYSCFEKCEEKIKYAVYNCLAIDTDMNPYDFDDDD